MRRAHAGTRTLLLLAPLALATGCDAFTFGVSGSDAPLKRIGPSEAFTMDGFGTAVAGVEGTVGGQPVSRLMVSGGPDHAFAMYGIWRNDALELGPALLDGCEAGSTEMCGGSSGAIAAAAQWVDNTGATQQVCVLRPEVTIRDGKPRLRSLCESRSSTADLRGPVGEDAVDTASWGAAVAALPAGSPAGAALVGAPSTGDRGRLYRYPLATMAAEEIDLSAAMPTAGADIGGALAVGELADGRALVAVGAPGDGTVIVAALDSSGADVRGCLDAPTGAEGYGEALAIGDFDAMGGPEIAVGGAAAAGQVWVYSSDDLTGPLSGCTGPTPMPATIACADLPAADGGPACDDSSFGAALAAGDVDADGADELIIGAPTATVRDKADAGAVWVVPGSASGLDTDAASPVFPSKPDEDARLGASLTTVATHVGTPEERDEPVAGAPGAEEVLVFFCTGVGNDTSRSGATRCLVQP